MTTTTKVGMITGTASALTLEQINTKIAAMVAAGQTNGNYTDSVVDTITYYERIWTTLPDAQEWIDFVATLDTPPQSAVILP
jgi:flagellar biosynthesis regulator FlaF